MQIPSKAEEPPDFSHENSFHWIINDKGEKKQWQEPEKTCSLANIR